MASQKNNTITDELVNQAQISTQALDQLISLCLPRIWKTVYLTCGGSSDVEDLVQMALIQAVEKIHEYRGPKRFTAWLDRLTINMVRMHFRKNALWLFRMEEYDGNTVGNYDTNTPETQESNRQMFSKLAGHLNKLKPRNRSAVVLSLMYGYSAKEIGELSGCSEEAAWKRIRRGYTQLQKQLNKDPGFKNILEREWS